MPVKLSAGCCSYRISPFPASPEFVPPSLLCLQRVAAVVDHISLTFRFLTALFYDFTNLQSSQFGLWQLSLRLDFRQGRLGTANTETKGGLPRIGGL